MDPTQFEHLLVETTRNACFIKVLDHDSDSRDEVRAELETAAKCDKATLMLNLCEISAPSRSLLVALLRVEAYLQKHGRSLKIYNLSPQCEQLFRKTNLDRLLDVFESEDVAFESLQLSLS